MLVVIEIFLLGHMRYNWIIFKTILEMFGNIEDCNAYHFILFHSVIRKLR